MNIGVSCTMDDNSDTNVNHNGNINYNIKINSKSGTIDTKSTEYISINQTTNDCYKYKYQPTQSNFDFFK